MDSNAGAGAVSRREFLKIAGAAGAVLGFGGGLGAIVAGCGGEETTTTSASGSESSVTTVTSEASTTTVSSGPEAGDPIKIGFVTPQTGPLAAFGIPDKYCMDRANESLKDGLVCADGKNHPVSILMQDSQSDTNRAAQVTGDLINNEGVQLMLAASTGTTVPPVADQCEASGVPLLSTDCTWEQFHFGRGLTSPTDSFKWTYLFFFGMGNLVPTYLGMWDLVSNNKMLGGMWPNEAAGNTARPIFTSAAEGVGYKVVDPGAWQPGTEDYTAMISMFKKDAVEVVQGFMTPPDMANFWSQSIQQGFKPKSRDHCHRDPLPSGDRGYRRSGSGPHYRGLVDARVALQVVPHRGDLPRVRRRVREAFEQSVDPAPASLRGLRNGGGRVEARHRPAFKGRYTGGDHVHEDGHNSRSGGLHVSRCRKLTASGSELLHEPVPWRTMGEGHRKMAVRSESRVQRNLPVSPHGRGDCFPGLGD